MEKNIAEELKKLDIQIGQKLFEIAKISRNSIKPSPLQGRIIKYLLNNSEKNTNQTDLENALHISKATISGTLNTMEKNGIISRIASGEDGRVKNIALTPKSKELHNEMKKSFILLEKELSKGITKEELQFFYAIMEKMRDNLKDKK